MSTDALLSLAEGKGYEVVYVRTPSAFSVENEGKSYIAMPTRLRGTSEREALAHELGHCEYGGFYNRYSPYDIRAKAERRADKWAFSKLVPYGQVMAAVKQGITEVWELADFFDVSCEFMRRAIEYYKTAIV